MGFGRRRALWNGTTIASDEDCESENSKLQKTKHDTSTHDFSTPARSTPALLLPQMLIYWSAVRLGVACKRNRPASHFG
jgi:hypothetical protein